MTLSALHQTKQLHRGPMVPNPFWVVTHRWGRDPPVRFFFFNSKYLHFASGETLPANSGASFAGGVTGGVAGGAGGARGARGATGATGATWMTLPESSSLVNQPQPQPHVPDVDPGLELCDVSDLSDLRGRWRKQPCLSLKKKTKVNDRSVLNRREPATSYSLVVAPLQTTLALA